MRVTKPIRVLLLFTLAVPVLAQPVIRIQPQDQSVPYGGTTTIFVQAEGTDPISYQWFFNSTNNPIANATNATLVVSNATPTHEGNYQVRLTQTGQATWSQSARLTLVSLSVAPFGTITMVPAFELNGAGTDVDSIAFWEAPEPTNTLMLVTAKGNDLVEVWKYPFQGNEKSSLVFTSNINGVAVDQDTDLLYVTDRIVSVFSLPSLQPQGTFGQGIIGVGENNLDILESTNGQTVLYISEDHRVHRFDAASKNHLGSFAPSVSSIETVLADDFYQAILVPEEQGPAGNPGVFVYHPDGTPFLKNGTNRFGASGIFDSDEEGILLYTFPSTGQGDNGAGFIVVSDQRLDVNDYEFFDRQTWAHLGTLRLQGVSNTDGIASTQQAMPGYPLGLFAAINNDTTTAVLGWDAIFQAAGFPPPRAIRISPAKSSAARGQDIAFAVEFSQPVTNFNNAADLLISHSGTANTGVTISGSGTLYEVTLTGLGGRGYLLLAINTASDIRDLQGRPLASSVTSVPVVIQSPYQAWAEEQGLVPGLNDDYSADPDDDRASNLEEFATDRAPLNANDVVKERLAVDSHNGANYLTYTFPARTGAVFTGTNALSATADDVHYALSGSLDLTNFNRPIVEISPPLEAGLPAPNQGWTYHTFGLEQSPPAGFIRREISLAEE